MKKLPTQSCEMSPFVRDPEEKEKLTKNKEIKIKPLVKPFPVPPSSGTPVSLPPGPQRAAGSAQNYFTNHSLQALISHIGRVC